MKDPPFPRLLLDPSDEADTGADQPLGSEAATAFERIPELLADTAPRAASLERLMKAVSSPGVRYAPFFRRVAELFDLKDGEVQQVFAEAGDPASWRLAGLPGVRAYDVKGGPRVAGAQALLVRFAAGKCFPEHRHAGAERLLLLEGGYEDDRGVRYHAGDEHRMAEGSTHTFRVFADGPCVGAALYEGGLIFSSFGLRFLAKVLGR